jgi:hypothetical protein
MVLDWDAATEKAKFAYTVFRGSQADLSKHLHWNDLPDADKEKMIFVAQYIANSLK